MSERETERDYLAGIHCPNCDHRIDEPINDIWKDSNVKQALKEGRSVDDIAVLDCPACGRWGYYNQGTYFFCRFCRREFHHSDEWDVITLADTVTLPTDGYDNETQPREQKK